MDGGLMSFLNQTIPRFNLLTPRDFELFAQLNLGNNLNAIFAVIGITLWYITVLCVVQIVEYLQKRYRKQTSNTQEPVKRGRFRKYIYDFSQAHLYVSFLYMGDRKHYTRSRRLACMYVAVMTCLAANGFSFSDGTGWNLFKWAIASIVCNVLQAPFVGLFRWLFSNTAPKHPIEENHVILSEVSREFDTQMLNSDNSEGINVEENVPTDPPPSRLSQVWERILDICDEIAEMFAKRFETKEVTWEALFSLFIISVFYFGICIVTLYLLPLSFTYITTVHQCILGVIAFVFFFGHLEFIYLKLRLSKYKSGVLKEWRVGSTNIVLSCIFMGSIVLMITFTAALIHYLPFLLPFHTPFHSYVNASVVALIIVFILRFIGLMLSIRWPGLKRDDPNLVRPKSLTPQYKFPHWVIYINYILCYAFVGLMAFFVLAYGVHFTARNQVWDWMMASWTGLSFYMFIRLPLTHFFMYIFYGTFVKTMEASLFPVEMDYGIFMTEQPEQNYELDSIPSDRRESLEEVENA
jgi:ABC-type multidrug transport system fused ATPase/permease subunit